MKFFSCIVFILFAYLCSSAQNQALNCPNNKRSKQDNEMKGNVKRIQVFTYDVNIDYYLKYHIIEKGKRANLLGNNRTLFNKRGETVLSEYFDIETGRFTMKDTFIFNVEGCLLEVRKIKDDKLLWYEKHTGNGDTLTTKRYNSLGDLISISKMLFNYKGQLIEELNYNEQGELTQKYTIEYKLDDKGEIISETVYDKNHKLFYIKSYTYNYEENTTSTTSTYNDMPDINTITKVKKNDKGLVILEERTDSKRHSVTKYEYEFDKQGNWIREISYYGNYPSQIVERAIEYFN